MGGGGQDPSGGGGQRGLGPRLGEGEALLWLRSRLRDIDGVIDEEAREEKDLQH